MNKFIKILLTVKDFVARVLKAVESIKDLSPGLKTESEKETYTFNLEKNGATTSVKFTYKKSKTEFHIGMLLQNDKDNPELFVSVNNAHLLSGYKYLAATHLCSGGEEFNENGVVRYMAIEQINNEYFSETTTEARKDEIIEQILSEVAEALSGQCATGEQANQV
ncbi:MAG: hypothetical protein LBC76_11610 [Treponema sp.]|jgi:hypothetical protein|nr:hypothetical protein [Treponema sp.]